MDTLNSIFALFDLAILFQVIHWSIILYLLYLAYDAARKNNIPMTIFLCSVLVIMVPKLGLDIPREELYCQHEHKDKDDLEIFKRAQEEQHGQTS